MREVSAWLEGRRAAPPDDLANALARVPLDGACALEALTAAGSSCLDAARARPGRVRASAFRLLEADALLTYACEAALESDDPAMALERILAAVGS